MPSGMPFAFGGMPGGMGGMPGGMGGMPGMPGMSGMGVGKKQQHSHDLNCSLTDLYQGDTVTASHLAYA